MSKKKVNWVYQGREIISVDDFPKGAIGFVYEVRNLTLNKNYFGRKTCVSERKVKLTKKEKELSENKRKTFKTVVKENSWKTYTGSNKALNEDLKKGHDYEKEILRFCFKKAELTHFETQAIVCSECMLSTDCYNDWYYAKVYKKFLI